MSDVHGDVDGDCGTGGIDGDKYGHEHGNCDKHCHGDGNQHSYRHAHAGDWYGDEHAGKHEHADEHGNGNEHAKLRLRDVHGDGDEYGDDDSGDGYSYVHDRSDGRRLDVDGDAHGCDVCDEHADRRGCGRGHAAAEHG